jgi:redox-sensitive bicupin YhaK (pirin superfamily)
MLVIRKADARGHFDHGWLDTYHTFSFAHYHDPEHMGFSVLRVINEDRVAPGKGFGTHGHRDMEILTVLLEGALEHRDSTGAGGVLRPGDVQRMTAGSGVTHSEFNHSQTAPLHFLQIWILPETRGLAPSYEEKHFPIPERRGKLQLLASRDTSQGSLRLHQDANVHATLLEKQGLEHELAPGRCAWVQVARGAVRVNGESLAAGDGAALRDVPKIALETKSECELLLFDLP